MRFVLGVLSLENTVEAENLTLATKLSWLSAIHVGQGKHREETGLLHFEPTLKNAFSPWSSLPQCSSLHHVGRVFCHLSGPTQHIPIQHVPTQQKQLWISKTSISTSGLEKMFKDTLTSNNLKRLNWSFYNRALNQNFKSM